MVDGSTKDRGTNIYIYIYRPLRDILLTHILSLFSPRQMIYFSLRLSLLPP